MSDLRVQIPQHVIRQPPVGHWLINDATKPPSRWRRFWTRVLLGWRWVDDETAPTVRAHVIAVKDKGPP